MSDIRLKQCSVGHLAPEWEFYKDPRYLDGLYPKCKFHKQERVNWRRSHSEEPYHPGEFPEERAAENEFLRRDLEATQPDERSELQPLKVDDESSLQHETGGSGSGLSTLLFNSQFLRKQSKNSAWSVR